VENVVEMRRESLKASKGGVRGRKPLMTWYGEDFGGDRPGVYVGSGAYVGIGRAELTVATSNVEAEERMSVNSTLYVDGAGGISAQGVDTGKGGINQVYAMDQAVLKGGSPAFAALNTTMVSNALVEGVLVASGKLDGVDAASLSGAFAMDHDLTPTDAATFASVVVTSIDTGAGVGFRELFAMDQAVRTVDVTAFQEAHVTGNLVVLGTVDGVDVASVLGARVSQRVTNTSSPTFAAFNTGSGMHQLYAMDQAVKADSAAAFAHVGAGTVNTGQGSSELHAMNQPLRISDSPTFAEVAVGSSSMNVGGTVNGVELSVLGSKIDQNVLTTGAPTFQTVDTGQGPRELYAMDQGMSTLAVVSFASMNVGADVDVTGSVNGLSLQGLAGSANATDLTLTDALAASTAHAAYLDQDVRMSSALAVETASTGHGANELYSMDQEVRSSDAVIFASLSLIAANASVSIAGGEGTL
jgi:hypothetical protein